MILAGLDFETTGLDPAIDRVTEVGLVLWDTIQHQPVRIIGYLVDRDGAHLSEEITKLTGLTNYMVDKWGLPERDALKTIGRTFDLCEAVVAHNGIDFDRIFLENWAKRDGVQLPDRLWIDTKTDLPQVAYGKSSSMKYMACDHGFLYDGHRAVGDVLAMLKILDRYDIHDVVEAAKSPTIHVQAMVDFDHNSLAKERGYHWKPEDKRWVKALKLRDLEKEGQEAKFKITVLK